MKPRLLDLFCGAGGAACGYQRAGFYVVGVDHKPQPRYVGDEFIEADVFTLLSEEPAIADAYDVVHAAPLWHRWTQRARANGTASEHPDDVGRVRPLLAALAIPYVLEIGTLSDGDAVTICGVSCGLGIVRHMRFETNWPLMVAPCSHRHGGCADGEYVAYRGRLARPSQGNRRPIPSRRREWRERADLGWMIAEEADLASPPVYTELIGHQLLSHVRARSAA